MVIVILVALSASYVHEEVRSYPRGLYYKTFYGRNLRILEIS